MSKKEAFDRLWNLLEIYNALSNVTRNNLEEAFEKDLKSFLNELGLKE